MKKSIEKLMASAGQPNGNDNRAGFFSVKGGLSLFLVATNKPSCTNDGTSCSGTNSGKCVNSATTDCSKTTNTPATACTSS